MPPPEHERQHTGQHQIGFGQQELAGGRIDRVLALGDLIARLVAHRAVVLGGPRRPGVGFGEMLRVRVLALRRASVTGIVAGTWRNLIVCRGGLVRGAAGVRVVQLRR